MRRPEDTFININVDGNMADRIEDLIGPNFTLARYPDDLQDHGEDAIPSYFVAVTEQGMEIANILHDQT